MGFCKLPHVLAFQCLVLKGHSTAEVLFEFKDDVLSAMEKGEITLAVFTDYSKAFDTALLNKLYRSGFTKNFLMQVYS